jgi:hypothetical protein
VDCEGVAKHTLNCLKINQNVLWYCTVCESGVTKIIKFVQALQQRLDKMEKHIKLEAELEVTKQLVNELRKAFDT